MCSWGKRERDEQQNGQTDGDPQEEIENFLDDQSHDQAETDEAALQEEGMAECAEVPDMRVEETEVFQEQRGRTTEKKRPANDGSGKISSRTRSQAERSHSPLLSLLHSDTDCQFPLSSSVATYPLFTIHAIAKQGLISKVKGGIRSGRDAIVCFSSQLAKAMSERKSTTPKSSDGRSPSSRTKSQADQRAERLRAEAQDKMAEEKA